MESGAQVYVKKEKSWKPATIVDHYYVKEIETFWIRDQDGHREHISIQKDEQVGDYLRIRDQGDISIEDMAELDNLTELMHLHEPAIVSALEQRFLRRRIYTFTGPILLAVNPYESLDIYNDEYINKFIQYSETNKETIAAEPHVYAIAARAHTAMIAASSSWREECQSQSILISGESGSGKTETSKFLMNYLVKVGSGSSSDTTSSASIAKKVLETTPLLESFGNARTLRNDNSSRFGKFIKLKFDKAGLMVGASLTTYLLEKVRLVSQNKDERNYHIFYEMCTGASAAQKREWHLLPMKEFTYLNQSGCMERKDGVNDAYLFKRTIEAMDVIGFTADEQNSIFRLLASILHCGNFVFENAEEVDKSGQNANTTFSKTSQQSLKAAAELLQVDKCRLEMQLRTRRITAGMDSVHMHLNPEQCSNARDGLCKALYGRIFEWLVGKINVFLANGSQPRSHSEAVLDEKRFIAILDIFGFEIFPQNSFEQLCINYANETLQQQFNEYIFKMEEHEYKAEGIAWNNVDFPDNQCVLNLISQRHVGILSLIDEECLIPKATDDSFVRKLYSRWEKDACFGGSKVQKVKGIFVVKHYAGSVTYHSAGFLEKNKDQLLQEAVDLLKSSSNPFLVSLCENGHFRVRGGGPTAGKGLLKARRLQPGAKGREASSIVAMSVGSQFKLQLVELLATIRKTAPHYIRCIKPNECTDPHMYDREHIIDQLRCNGVIEAVRVARTGFPVRVLHQDFMHRFGALLKHQRKGTIEERVQELLPLLPKRGGSSSANESKDMSKFAIACLQSGLQVGFSKIFMRQSAFDTLEKLRAGTVGSFMITLESFFHMIVARKRYLHFRSSIMTLQSVFKLRLRKRKRRIQRAVVLLQRTLLMLLVRGKFIRRLKKHRQQVHDAAMEKMRIEEAHRTERKQEKEKTAIKIKIKKERAEEAERIEKQEVKELQKRRQEKKEEDEAAAAVPRKKSDASKDFEATEQSLAESSKAIASDDIEVFDKEAGSNTSNPFTDHSVESASSTSSSTSISSPRYLAISKKHDEEHRHHKSEDRVSELSGPSRATRIVNLPRLHSLKQTQWVNDEDRFSCHICNKRFSIFRRKHHCRACGEIICSSDSLHHRIADKTSRVCVSCVAFHANDSPKKSAMKISLSNSSEDWVNPWPEPPYPSNEAERMVLLRQMDIKALGKEGDFSMFCGIASRTFKCPIAAVSIVEADEQRLLASMGMSQEALPRELSFDAHTICDINPLIILDTKNDARFKENPMVQGAVKIRFYAGAPILSPQGYCLGTVSVYDTKPRRSVDKEHIAVLSNLAALAAGCLFRRYNESL